MGLLLEINDGAVATFSSGLLSNLPKIKNNGISGISLSQDYDGDVDISSSFDHFMMTTMNPLSDQYNPPE